MSSPPRHHPVMLAEIVDLLAPALAGHEPVLVDGTLGLGGHAEALLRACPDAQSDRPGPRSPSAGPGGGPAGPVR